MVELGRVVIYRSRTGAYEVPAIVNCTSASINPKGVESGGVPALSAPGNVHLTVFTPGIPGSPATFPAFEPGVGGRSENVTGCYQEWDVAEGDGPGMWRRVVG